MHKKSDFQWTQEAEVAFKQMKKLIAELPMRTAPKENEKPRASIKGQILADFIVERPEEESPDVPMMEPEEISEPWTLFTDGSYCIDGSGAGLILTNPEGAEFTYAMRFRFEATNNEAKYEALIADLRIVEQMGANVILGKSKRAQQATSRNFPSSKCRGANTTSGRPKQRCIYKLLHLTGPFPEGPGKVKFLIVAIDYFTKWIEAKPVATITGNQVKKFVWDNICEKLSIRQCFASVKHPQTNGLVERANRSLGEGIKARLDERSKDWMGELSHVLWAHRTMIKSSNGETPFSLTYGTEAVIPAEIGMPTLRTAEIDLIKNDEALEINLDLIEEKREQAAIQEAKSKAKMEKYYNSKVRGTSFKSGDRVYHNNDASHAKDGGKLGPKWEGPYKVAESLGR
ncbi:reverse transcriptase domain-containing protein [Tanacetum coccineum]